MTEKCFNWAFIGAGGIAHSVAKRITKCGRHKVAAVYNRTYSRAVAFAEKFGGKAYESLEDAVNAPDVEGVYINVTNNVHYDYCLRALACGKPVLMEKPFTTDRAQAATLFETAERNNIYLCEAMWTWFSDQANAVKAAIDGGELGKVTGGLITLCLPIAFGKSSRLLKSELAGGALLDVGVYPITYAYRLFGMPNSIECGAKFKFGVDMSDDIVFKYDGFEIKLMASIRSLRGVGEKLVITGENGKLASGAYHSGAGFKISGKKASRYPTDKNSMLTQFDRVANEIRQGKLISEFVSHKASLDVMQLLDAVREKIGLKFSFEQ